MLRTLVRGEEEESDEGNINRHTNKSRIQRSTRREWESRRGKGRIAEDFGPSEFTVKTLHGEMGEHIHYDTHV